MSSTPFREDCLQDRLVLVTGAAGGIGKVLVNRLLAHGAVVAVNDILDEDTASKTFPDHERLHYFQADITQDDSVSDLFASIEDSLGLPNVVCCHAGVAPAYAYLDYPTSEFEKVMDVNTKGCFIVSREAAKRMVQVSGRETPSRIIFTSSWVESNAWPHIGPYSASKSAVKMLMKTLANETAGSHLLVNSIAPGIVNIGMARHQWDTDPEYRALASRAIPLGYLQDPESVADAFVFLCSDAANYITGQTLVVDGGCDLYPCDRG